MGYTTLPSTEPMRCRFHRRGIAAAILVISGFMAPAARAQADVLQAVDHTTRFLISNWSSDPQLKKVMPPQVLPLSAGSRVYGACGEQVRGVEVGGSAYCGTTHTIFLVPEELKAFYQVFGASSVAYVVAHEFGHAIQAAYGIQLEGTARELQADCLAGLVFRTGKNELGLTRDSVLAMAQTAYNIGSASHGSGAQRAYALLSGMGVLQASCKGSVMQALAQGQIKEPALLKLSQQRSGGNRPDTSRTPYPKTLQGALGL
jgi:hypothetical protein